MAQGQGLCLASGTRTVHFLPWDKTLLLHLTILGNIALYCKERKSVMTEQSTSYDNHLAY